MSEKKGTLLISSELIDKYISRILEIQGVNHYEKYFKLLENFAMEIMPPNISVGIMKKIKEEAMKKDA